ncbi:MAG: hypothetical protein ACI304_00415 [Lepagella sp.]
MVDLAVGVNIFNHNQQFCFELFLIHKYSNNSSNYNYYRAGKFFYVHKILSAFASFCGQKVLLLMSGFISLALMLPAGLVYRPGLSTGCYAVIVMV